MTKQYFLPMLIAALTACSCGGGDSYPKKETPAPQQNNQAPVANAGDNQQVNINTSVLLNASNSSDADGDPLSYQWQLTTPESSNTQLSSETLLSPTFTPDIAGNYIAKLVVNDGNINSAEDSITITASEAELTTFNPEGYQLAWQDEFNNFNSDNWSKGLAYDQDPTIAMIWNQQTGGSHLLNDKYAGYILDQNTYTEEGQLFLANKKEQIVGTDPNRNFDYSTGWINSLRKKYFNGTSNGIYLEVKAKFPSGTKVWPAIWLIAERRAWPPEVDIWEYFGTFFNANWGTDQMYMRYIYGHWSDTKNHSVALDNFQNNYDASNSWHIYGFQWTASTMTWSIDGEQVHQKTKGIDIPEDDWPNEDMALVINNGLMSAADEGYTNFPNYLVLDYIALYQN